MPVELLIEALKWLDCRELLICSSVCGPLRIVIKNSLELQYIIELAADGMVDISSCRMTTADRLRLLLDRRQRWRVLDWTDKVFVPVPGACQAYELVGGVFAKSMGDAILHGSHHLIATWLPSRTEPARTIVREDLGVATRDFAIDPSQDLIALVDADDSREAPGFSIRVHCKTISTNVKHPKARFNQLRAPIPFELGSSFIQIVDDVIGMFFWVHGPGLIVWRWATAEVLVYCIGLDLPMGTWDFSFLSNRAFMITSTSGAGAIDLYSFSGKAPAWPNPLPPPTHVATLSLPPLKEGQELHHFSTHSGPIVHGPMPGKPFEPAREKRIHLMSLHYGERGPRYHMFVHNHYLMSHIPPGFGSGEAWKMVELPWDSWGPANTRFLEHNVHFQWLRYVHGQRLVLPPFLPSWPLPQATLCIIDFNLHPKRIDDPVPVTNSQGMEGKFEVVLDRSTIQANAVFLNDVVTYLPYSLSSRTGSFNYSGFMIDDERIIGMKSMAFADGDMSDVDVYTF